MNRPTNEARTRAVLDLVLKERRVQEARYGDVSEKFSDGSGPSTRWLLPYTSQPASAIEKSLRLDYEDFEEEAGLVTWVHLVREEVAEAFQESDPERLAAELIQVAALCVSWVERLPVHEEEGAESTPLHLELSKVRAIRSDIESLRSALEKTQEDGSNMGDIAGYIYCGYDYCPDCAVKALVEDEFRFSLGPEKFKSAADFVRHVADYENIDYDDPQTYGSDEFPKVIFSEQVEDVLCCDCGKSLSA